MNVKELKSFLSDDITQIDIEDSNGNTKYTIELNRYSVADVQSEENNKVILRLQEI